MTEKSDLDKLDMKPPRENKPRVLIDLDGVIRDFVGSLVRVYNREFPQHEVLPVTSRRLEKFFPVKEKIYDFFEAGWIEEIMEEAEPYPDAVEALHRWKSEFEIVIVTSQPEASRASTFTWIGRHDIPTREVHISYYKSDIQGIALLDDFSNNLDEFRETGRLAVCLDQPWNRQWSGPRVKTVDQFFRYVQHRLYQNERPREEKKYYT